MEESSEGKVASAGTAVKSAAPPNPIQRKLDRILNSKLETDQEMITALESVSTVLSGGNTRQNRRNLRGLVEQQAVQQNQIFLEQLLSVRKQLGEIEEEANAMHDCCTGMSGRLKVTKEQTRDLINQTTRLQADSSRLEKRSVVVNAFLASFTLSAAEERVLQVDADANQPVTAEFFPALRRVRQIHADCKQLLAHKQNAAALEIVERMAALLERSYERLYRWIQRECRLLNVDVIELNPVLCLAFEAMQDRPVLFKYSLDEYATARRNNLVRGFIEALTRGAGSSKPIELSSHDPQRYTSDMLAWLHQTLASEKDLLHAMLKHCAGELVKEHTVHVLTQAMDGLSRPFKIRVEQCLSAENGPVVLYKLTNLFAFYLSMMSASLGKESNVLGAISELSELTASLFNSSLSSHLQRLISRIEPPSDDLQVPQAVHQVLLLLRDVLQTHDSTMANMADKKTNFQKIFSMVVDPLCQTITVSSAHLDAVQVAVYTMNCLSAIHSLLSLYPYTEHRLEMLSAQMEAQQDVLVSEQAGVMLHRAGLQLVYNKVLQHDRQMGPMSQLPETDPPAIRNWMEKFDLLLAKPDSYLLPECTLLSSLKIREAVKKRTMELICSAYETVVERVQLPTNNYSDVTCKSVEQVRSLLI